MGGVWYRMSLAAASAAGSGWEWLLVGGVGLFIGLAAAVTHDDPVHSNQLGCLGTLVVGVVGAIVGELLLGRLFNIDSSDVLGIVLSAFIGATGLVMLFSNRLYRRRSEPEGGS